MTISNEPILCLFIVGIFNIFFHMVKVLEVIFKMSGRGTLSLNFGGKYEKSKTRAQKLGKAEMMKWNG